MEHCTRIQQSLDYIEANLRTELTASELAQHAGFSVFHYYRLFQRYTGLPVMQYILRRRLLHAIYDVRNGTKQIDAALAYGFDTYAGFYKAFQREFGCTPAVFLKKNRAKRPVRIELLKEETMNLTHAQAREALKYWQMETEAIGDLYYGSSGNKATNAVYVGESFVLKRSRERAGLQTSLTLAGALKETGVDTQTPVQASNGQTCVELDGWFYCLYSRLQGREMIAASLYEEDGEEKARFVGEVIGQLHLALQMAKIVVKEADLLDSVQNWALPNAKEILNLPEAFCQSYIDAFQKLYPDLPRQIIHRDPNPGNIVMAEEAWGVIDFEMAERNIRLFDPCYAATAVLSESFEQKNERKLNEWLRIYRNILLGYDSVVHLTEQEQKAAPFVVMANQLICVAWFSSQPQFEEIADTNRQMTLWLMEHFEQLQL